MLLSGSGHRPDRSTHSSNGSFHGSQGSLGLHGCRADKPTGPGAILHHNQHHGLPSNADYRENIPTANFQPPYGREMMPPSANPSKEKEKEGLRDIVPPLCTFRLKPIRQKTKNAVVRCFSRYMIRIVGVWCVTFVFSTGEHHGHR